MPKSIILVSAFILTAMTVSAQKKQVIYFQNGKKAVEGNWKIVYGHMETPDIFGAILNREKEQVTNSHITPLKIHGFDNGYRNRNLQFEGVCTIYYPSGQICQKTSYDHGIPQGPFEYYDANGTLMVKGNYKDGMPDGKWQYFNYDGKKYLEAAYHAYSQVELDSLFSGRIKITESAPDKNSEDFNSLRNTLTRATDEYFRGYCKKLPTNTRPDGEIVFYDKNGEKEAMLHFKNGAKIGDWVRYDNGSEKFKAVYSNNILTALYDADKKNVLKDSLQAKGNDYSYIFNKDVKVLQQVFYSGDPYAIDPGIMDASVAAPPDPQPSEDLVFKYVEQMPEFPGNIIQYLESHIKYPKTGGEGRIIVQFVVRADGNVTNVQVLRGIDAACDAEAMRVVREMPKWKPGKQNGRAVPVSYSLPVIFKKQ